MTIRILSNMKRHKNLSCGDEKELDGMLQSLLLYYKYFRKDLKKIRFKINLYDPCVANKIINKKQHTVTWHVDNLKPSYVDKRVKQLSSLVEDPLCKWQY